MQADALKLLSETAVKASGQRIFTASAEPGHVYYRLDSDGDLLYCEAEPKPAAHAAGDLATVAAKAAEFRAKTPDDAGDGSEVWYSRTGVVCLYNRRLRRDRCLLGLETSAPLLAIQGWDARPAGITQVELVQLIRTTFADCLKAHPDLRQKVGKVDIAKAQQSAGVVDVGKVSISKSMIAEASGASALPDVLTFDVPVFDTPKLPVRAQVRVAFDLDPQTERFRLVPLPGQVEAAFVAGEDYVRARLHDALAEIDGGDQVPVFYGTPN